MTNPLKIDEPAQLLVEGRDAQAFFCAFLEKMKIQDMQVHNFGGINELPGFLRGFVRIPDFADNVRSLGIVRDAEDNPRSAFQSVCSALERARLPLPSGPETPTTGRPYVSVLILPDSETPGMLETVCLRAVSSDPVMECVDEYFECVNQRGFHPRLIDKAKLQAFLASRPEQELLGHAIRNNSISWESEEFNHIKQFLSSLLP